MPKETYWIKHDYHARKDPKCIALINEFGVGGYGLYWCLIEMMYEQGGKIKKFPALYSGLAKEFRIKEAALIKQIETMANKYELLVQDVSHLWSEAVLVRLFVREEKTKRISDVRSKAGINSGISRRKNKRKHLLNKNKQNEPEEKRGEEIRKEQYTVPTMEDFRQFFEDNGYSKELAEQAYEHYSDLDWHDSNGNKVTNWKLKMRSTWFKNNDKAPVVKQPYNDPNNKW